MMKITSSQLNCCQVTSVFLACNDGIKQSQL